MSEPQVDLSIVIPAYNEEDRIALTLKKSLEFFEGLKSRFEIIVVDDGSTDGTANVVTQFEKSQRPIRLISYPNNEGKGYAVKFGVLNSQGQNILIMDADGSTPLSEYLKLKSKLDEGYKIAIGSRALFDENSKVNTVWYRKLLGRVFNALVNIILVPGIEDTQCGFKLFSGDIAKNVFEKQTIRGFAFDCEILHYCQRLGLDIAEVPINWTNVEGSKVNLAIHPLNMLKDIILVRLQLS